MGGVVRRGQSSGAPEQAEILGGDRTVGCRRVVAPETRLSRWRAQRPRWQPARGDKPRLSPLERSEHRWRDREIARRVAAGEPIAELAEEYGALPRTIERWARRGSQQSATRE
jgi:hypothetical protein